MNTAPMQWGKHPIRQRLVLLFFFVVASVLLGRAVWLQLLDKDFLRYHGEIRSVRTVPVPARRGIITDRNNEYLAISTPIQSLWCRPRELLRHPAGLVRLAKLLKVEPEILITRLQDRRDRDFLWLRRHATPTLAQHVLDLELPGLHADWEYRRYYPAADVTAHVVGFTDVDGVGREGMEMAYDTWLGGKAGKKRVLQDRLGRIVEHIENIQIGQEGQTLILSIDLRIQYLAWRALQRIVRRYRARSASLVMLDTTTGEVLTMLSQPAYNPNHRSGDFRQYYRNRPVTDVFEPGSTIKPFTVLAALESQYYTPETHVDTNPGRLGIGRHTVRDIQNYGTLDVNGILSKSSNVGISKIALSLDPGQHLSVLARLGFGQVTGSTFPGEASGNLRHTDARSPVERATLAFGYGLSVNALQLARAYAVLANEGILLPVSFIRQDGATNEERGRRLFARDTTRTLVRMMENVTLPGGTGTRAAIQGYRVAGKTGTVHKTGQDGYQDNQYLALFAGLAPASRPRLAMVVVIDEPQGTDYYGGLVAAPVFSTVMGQALRIMNITPDDHHAYQNIHTGVIVKPPATVAGK